MARREAAIARERSNLGAGNTPLEAVVVAFTKLCGRKTGIVLPELANVVAPARSIENNKTIVGEQGIGRCEAVPLRWRNDCQKARRSCQSHVYRLTCSVKPSVRSIDGAVPGTAAAEGVIVGVAANTQSYTRQRLLQKCEINQRALAACEFYPRQF